MSRAYHNSSKRSTLCLGDRFGRVDVVLSHDMDCMQIHKMQEARLTQGVRSTRIHTPYRTATRASMP
jgi:hypothetical protein